MPPRHLCVKPCQLCDHSATIGSATPRCAQLQYHTDIFPKSLYYGMIAHRRL